VIKISYRYLFCWQ